MDKTIKEINYDGINKELIVLERVKRACVQYLSKELVFDANYDSFLEMYVIRVIKEQLAIRAGEQIIKFPDNWKEAFKERWFPDRLKKRYPVRYKIYDALVMFPDLLKKHPVPKDLRKENFYLTYAEYGSIMPKKRSE